MPKINKPKNILPGKLYKITNPNNPKYYIGSTILPLEKRFIQHNRAKKSFEKGNKSARKLASFELLEGGSIELIQDFPCQSRRELQKAEGKLIRDNKENITNFFVCDVSCHDLFKALGILKKLKFASV